jgi:hypothetical protein
MRSDKGPWQDPNILKVFIFFRLLFFPKYVPVVLPLLLLCICNSAITVVCMQMVLNGEIQCSRQIVTISNDEGTVIECDKASYPMVYFLIPS